jgi:hypothetical protein
MDAALPTVFALSVAVVLVFAHPADGSAAPSASPASSVRVMMFGDSVMLGARDELLARFAGAPVTVDAVESRSIIGALGVMQAAQPLGDVVVLDLGYNDSDDPAVFRTRIDAAMAVLAAVPRVVWLNQKEFTPQRAGMNAELDAARARYANLDVVDWNAEVAAHPEDVTGDGIHLTPAGQVAMATLVRREFDAYVASLTIPATSAPRSSTVTSVARPRPRLRHASSSRRNGSDGVSGRVVLAGVLAAFVLVGLLALRVRRTRPSVD